MPTQAASPHRLSKVTVRGARASNSVCQGRQWLAVDKVRVPTPRHSRSRRLPGLITLCHRSLVPLHWSSDGQASGVVARLRGAFSLDRTGGRAVEGARLESVWGRKALVGSNPTLSVWHEMAGKGSPARSGRTNRFSHLNRESFYAARRTTRCDAVVDCG